VKIASLLAAPGTSIFRPIRRAPALEADVEGRCRDADHGCRREWRAVRRYQLKLNSYDPVSTLNSPTRLQRPALRTSRREGGAAALRQNRCSGRRRQHPDAGGVQPTPTRSLCKSPTRPATAWRIQSENSGQRFCHGHQRYGCGGGYELALATDHIILAPMTARRRWRCRKWPLLAVLPGPAG